MTLLSEQLKSNILPVRRGSANNINRKFDNAELVVERTGALLSKCEPVVLKLFLLLHLLLDLGVVLWILLRK